jgi:shikimate kinase
MTDTDISLFLVGPMGAGKSTLGRQLAQLLNRPFHDSDKEIEARTGADIPWIFDREGEEGFRKREQLVIDELTQLPAIVLATGGGAVLAETNRRYLHERGHVVYLWTPVELQLARTRHDNSRPLLKQSNPEEVLTRLFIERDPLYREVAHQIVSTTGNNMKKVTDQILACLNKVADT